MLIIIIMNWVLLQLGHPGAPRRVAFLDAEG